MQAADVHDQGVLISQDQYRRLCDRLLGEMYATMQEGELQMRAGDALLLRGTKHAWSNRTMDPVRIAFALIGAVTMSISTGATSGGDIDGTA